MGIAWFLPMTVTAPSSVTTSVTSYAGCLPSCR